jgi:uncharacterized protein YodC (DUF2158 family)
MAGKIKNQFEKGDVVVLKSGGPPMTIDLVPGDGKGYGTDTHSEYQTKWFKGASKEHGSFSEHLLQKYEPPKKA